MVIISVILLELSFIMDKTKKGIALFITLLIIASILSIVAVSFSYLEKARHDASRVSALIQGNLLYKHTSNILKRIFPKGKADSKKLDILYGMPLMLSAKKSDFMVNLQCHPLLLGVPIQWLDEDFTKKRPARYELAREVLTNIMELYEIRNPSQFETSLFAVLTGKEEEDSEYSKRLNIPKGFSSNRQFERFLLDYRLKYDDENIYKVPWDRYFTFIDVTQNAVIDGGYLTVELISSAFDIPIDIVKEGWIVDSEFETKPTLAKFLEDNGVTIKPDKSLFSDKGLNAIHCEQTYAYRDGHYRFSFDYSDERSINFEFNGRI